VLALREAVTAAGAELKIVAPKIGGAIAADGTVIEADFQLAGGSSVLFDCVYISLSKTGATNLATEAGAVAWVHDAYAHLKVIGSNRAAQPLLDAAGVVADAGIQSGGKQGKFLATAAKGRVWDREPNVRTIF
jgi:catalase